MAQRLLRKCDICDDNSGIYFCYECQQFMCKPCQISHGKIQATKRHSVTESSAVDRKVLSLGVTCKLHDKDFVLFCEKCSCLVCLVCITSVHKGHSYHGIEEAGNNKRKVIQQDVRGLKAKIDNISSSIEDIQSNKQPKIKESCEQYVRNIQSLTVEFHNIIDFISETNVTEATDFSVLEQQQLEFDLAKLKKTYKEYTEISENLAQSINEKHDITFLLVEKSNRAQFEGLSEIPSVKEPKQFKEFDKAEFASQIIDQIRSKYSIRSNDSDDEEYKTDSATDENISDNEDTCIPREFERLDGFNSLWRRNNSKRGGFCRKPRGFRGKPRGFRGRSWQQNS